MFFFFLREIFYEHSESKGEIPFGKTECPPPQQFARSTLRMLPIVLPFGCQVSFADVVVLPARQPDTAR